MTKKPVLSSFFIIGLATKVIQQDVLKFYRLFVCFYT